MVLGHSSIEESHRAISKSEGNVVWRQGMDSYKAGEAVEYILEGWVERERERLNKFV